MAVRPRFDPRAEFTASRSFTYNGTQYAAGDVFNKEGVAPFKLNMLYGSRAINQSDPGAPGAGPVQMTETGGGYYEITAPWLDEPEKVRGKAKAEARQTELAEAGEPLDHHGVSITESGGGWYEVAAEWAEEPQKVQGMEEAQRVATQLRAEGAPPEHYTLVTVEPIEDREGYFHVDAPWLEGIETHEGKEVAEARAQLIREVGPPEGGYDAEAIQKARTDRAEAEAEAAAKAREEADAAKAEQERRDAFTESFVLSSETTGEGDEAATVYRVAGPGLKAPEEFDDQAAAETRLTELREAGPPEGWKPATE